MIIFNQRFSDKIQLMIKEQDLLAETLKSISHFGKDYEYLQSLLNASTWQDFEEKILLLAQKSTKSIRMQNKICYNIAKNVAFLITSKLKKFNNWNKISIQKWKPSLIFLQKDIQFDLEYKFMHEKSQNIFEAYTLISMIEFDQEEKKLRENFLQNSLDALFSESPNKQSYSYKCIQSISADERSKLEIIAVNTFNLLNQRNQDLIKKDLIFNKYFKTDKAEIFNELLNLQSQKMEELKTKILQLKLIKKDEGVYELEGDCQVNKICLTSENLIKCLSRSGQIYEHLANNLVNFIEEDVIFKFDIESMLDKQDSLDSFLRIKTDIKSSVNRQNVMSSLELIIKKALTVISSLKDNKKIYKFVEGKIIQVSQQKSMVFCLKLLTYPFRTKHNFKLECSDDDWDSPPPIQIHLKTEYLQDAFMNIISYFLETSKRVSSQAMNAFCQVIRWIYYSKKSEKLVDVIFSTQNKEKNLNPIFLKLILKYLEQQKQSKLPYHLGVWLIQYFGTIQKPKEFIDDSFKQIYFAIYSFIIENNRYLTIYRYELDEFRYQNQYKLQFYEMVEKFMSKNSDFTSTIIDLWMKELQFFQTSTFNFETNRKYRLSMLVIMFKNQHFPVTQSIKQRVKNLLFITDFLKLSVKKQYKYIWQAFLKKIDDNNSQFQNILMRALKHTQNYEIMAENMQKIYYRKEIPQSMKEFTQSVSRFIFRLSVGKLELTEAQIIKLMDLMLNLSIIQNKLREKAQLLSQSYSRQQLEWLHSLEENCFRSFLSDSFLDLFDVIRDYLTEQITNLQQINTIIIGFGKYIKYLINNKQNIILTHQLIDLIDKMLRKKSSNMDCQFFPQFYNYHKESIITFLNIIFKDNKFKFQGNDPSHEYYQFSYAYQSIKSDKNVKESWEALNLQLLESALKRFIGQVFTNQSWQYTVLFNNFKYEKTNNLKNFEKTVQCDLAIRLTRQFNPQRLDFYHRIFKIIDDCYHRRSRDDLQCPKISINIELPPEPLVLIVKASELDRFYESYKNFIKKMFENYEKYEVSTTFEELYKFLVNELPDEETTKIKSQILKQLISCLNALLENPNSQWEKYEKIHGYINSVLSDFEVSIGEMISNQFIERYLIKVSQLLQNKFRQTKSAKPFIKLIERLIPDSKPDVHDEDFNKYMKYSALICIQLLKNIKDDDILEISISLIAKLIRCGDKFFDQYLVEFFKSIQEQKDKFSELFCELIERQLRQASIELEIKSHFLKLSFKNQEKIDQNRVKISDLVKIFSNKYKYCKKQFIKVVEAITTKIVLKQQNRNEKYLILNPNEKFEYSTILRNKFINLQFSDTLKYILSSYINSINASEKSKFVMKLRELRIICYNYPILTSFILMHPKKHGDKTLPLIDYLYEMFTMNTFDEEQYAFFGYMSLDICPIINHQNKLIFFSEYLCHRLISKLMEGQLTNRSLIFIFFMTKIKRFADLCFKKIANSKSICDLLWEKLNRMRENFTFKTHHNFLLYITISILYRENNMEQLFNYCDYKKQTNDWEDYNKIVSQNWTPFKNLVLKQRQNEKFKIVKNYQCSNADIYHYFDTIYQEWYKFTSKEDEEINLSKIESIVMKKIDLQNEHHKYIGSIATTHAKNYCDIESSISTTYFQSHRSCFQAFHLFFMDHDGTENNLTRRRRRMKDSEYSIFTELHNVVENQSQSSENEDIQDEININQQSNFAPEEFVRVRNRKQSDDEQSQDIEKQLESRLNDLPSEKIIEVNISEGKIEEFPNEMFEIFSKINDRLTTLQRPLLNINDVKGKNLSEKLQFLQSKDLETDFDLKQAIMSIEQFENFCLANVNKLERLGSQRRNIVRNIEDVMLLKYVQRSISSDSVDYIIDTIDENYQLLPNTLPHKRSMEEIEQHENKKKVQNEVKHINSYLVPEQNFEEIDDDKLYEIILSFYYSCSIIPKEYFVPFFENKRIQQKIINTLLYIYKNPFDNNHFPNKISSLGLEKLTWDITEKSETAQSEIRKRISDVFIEAKNYCFYQEKDYLNNEIGLKGIKDIYYEPSIGASNQKFKPIFEVLEITFNSELKKIEENEEYECKNIFSLLSGVSQLSESQLQKLMKLLENIHKKSLRISSNQSSEVGQSQITARVQQAKQYNIQNNLKQLLKDQKIKAGIKSTFPLEAQGRDAFFVYLFMNTGVYQHEDLLKFHKSIIKADIAKSSNVFFSNKAFKLYTQQQLKDCSWLKQSKNILPCMIKSLSNRIKLSEQPFYRLCTYPNFLSIEFKSELLYKKVSDYQREFSFRGSQEIVAQRKKGIFESAFLDLRNKPDGFWYQNFSVKFMNQAGALESGYGRGVAKDWYAFVTKGMANLNYGIFMKTSKNYYYFNRESWINPRHLQFLQFIGKLFALSIINREFYLAPSFSILIYKMIVGEKIEISDIVKEFDEGEVIKNIQKLREYHDDSLFCQSFVYQDKRLISNKNLELLKRKRSMDAIETNIKENNLYLIQEAVQMKQEEEDLPKMNEMKEEQILENEQAPKMIKVLKIGQSIELIPGGAEISVNMENRQQFIALTKQKIYDIIVNGVKQQFNAFMSGFKRVVKPDFIKNISAQELRELAQGCDKISIEDLKKHVTLARSMDKSPQIQWFWSCLQKLSARDRMYLIQHWTGLPKISAEGFKGTNLTIVKGQYNGRLFAQTCFNKLHLPEFENQEKMLEAITMAINSVKIGQSIIED